jgi:hypothetical protein
MKNRLLPAGLIVVLFAVAMVLKKRDQTPVPAESPEDVVNKFFDAARQGDDAACLGLVAGEYRRSLENDRSQVGPAAFRESLKRMAAGMKGIGIKTSAETPVEGVALDVELVYADRNEKQRMVLVRQGGGWAILSVDSAQMQKPPVAYGTPVFDDTASPEK